MLPDQVSNPGPLTYESGALPIALRGPATRRLMLLYICTKFHENILHNIKVIEQTRFPLEKFQRGIISQKLMVELKLLFSAHCLTLVYFFTRFHENIFDG